MQGGRALSWPFARTSPLASKLANFWRLTAKLSQAGWHKLRATAVDFWDLVGPGGKLHPEEFIEHNGDVLVQLLLLAVSAYLLLQNRFKPSAKHDAPLTEEVGVLASACVKHEVC